MSAVELINEQLEDLYWKDKNSHPHVIMDHFLYIYIYMVIPYNVSN